MNHQADRTPNMAVSITNLAVKINAEPSISQTSLNETVSNVVKHDKNVPKRSNQSPYLRFLNILWKSMDGIPSIGLPFSTDPIIFLA